MTWTDLYRRVARAAERMPPPATGPTFDSDIFAAGEARALVGIRERYPTCTFTPRDLWMVSDDDLAFLAEAAERAKQRQDEQEAAIETT